MKTKDLILTRLREATEHRMTRRRMSELIRYREDGEDALRSLIRDGAVVRVRDDERHKPGPRPVLYELKKRVAS